MPGPSQTVPFKLQHATTSFKAPYSDYPPLAMQFQPSLSPHVSFQLAFGLPANWKGELLCGRFHQLYDACMMRRRGSRSCCGDILQHNLRRSQVARWNLNHGQPCFCEEIMLSILKPLAIAQEPYIFCLCAFNLAVCAFFDLVSATCISPRFLSFTGYIPFHSECVCSTLDNDRLALF